MSYTPRGGGTITLDVDGADQARREVDSVGDSLRRLNNTDLNRVSAETDTIGSRFASMGAKAGGALAAVATAATAVALGAWVKTAIDAADEMGELAQKAGVAVQDVAGLQLAFQMGGLAGDAMVSSMAKLSKEIVSGGDKLAELGIQTATANGAFRSSRDVLADVADRFSSMETGVEKTALAVELFGKSGADMIPLLNGGAQGLREMDEMAAKLGLTLDQETADAAGQFNDSLDFMMLAGQGIGRHMAAELLPTLNSVAGSFIKLTTEGDGVRKIANVISTGFKGIYTAGVVVAQIFNTVGTVVGTNIGLVLGSLGTLGKTLKLFIEGEYSKAWQTATTGMAAHAASVSSTGADLRKSWSASATAISDVWSDAGGEVVAAMAATTKATNAAAVSAEDLGKKAAKAADEAARAAQRHADAYARLVGSVEQQIAAAEREAAGLAALTDSQRLSRDLDQQLRSGKLELSAASIRYLQSQIETLAVHEDTIRVNRQRAQEEQEWARIREAAAEVEAEAARRAAEQRNDDWASFERTAHDTFVSITDGGKGAVDRLRETFKNGFFDWLYQMTLKKWIINVQTATASGGGGISSLIGAATGGQGVLGAAGNLYSSLAGGATLGGGLGTGFLGSLAAGLEGVTGEAALARLGLTSNLGATIGNSLAGTLGPSISGAISSGLGALASAGPVLAAIAVGRELNKAISGGLEIKGLSGITNNIGVVGGILNRAFGRGPREVTASGIVGTFGADDFSGTKYEEWQKKGGWFKSTKRGTDNPALDSEMAAVLSSAYKDMKASTAAFAEALGVPTDTVSAYTKQIKLAFTGDATKDQQALANVLAQVSDELATGVLPNIAAFVRDGETAAITLQRLAVEFQTVGQLVEIIGATSGLSLEARTRLVELTGGLEAFASRAAFFAENFLTEAERLEPARKVVTETLASVGLAFVDTRKEFSDAVRGLNLADEGDAKIFASLMGVQEQFAALYPVIEDTAKAVEAATQAIEGQRRSLQDQLGDLTMTPAQKAARERAQVDPSNLGLFDQVQAAAAAKAIGEINSQLQGEIDALTKSRMTAAEVRALETRGMDASTVALYDKLMATKAEIAATEEATAAIARASEAAAAAQQEAADAYAASVTSMGDALARSMTQAREAAQALRDFNDALELGNLSPLSSEEKYREAKRRFEAADPTDTEAATTFLNASKERDADAIYYRRDYDAVRAKIALGAVQQDQAADAIPALWRATQAAMMPSVAPAPVLFPAVTPARAAATTSTVVGSEDVLKEEIGLMREQLATALSAIADNTAKSTDILDRVTSGGSEMVVKA